MIIVKRQAEVYQELSGSAIIVLIHSTSPPTRDPKMYMCFTVAEAIDRITKELNEATTLHAVQPQSKQRHPIPR